MRVVYGIGRLKLTKPSCVAVGVFDGLHRGHQSVIKKVVSIAKRRQLQSVILTFFPHPDSIVNPEKKSPLLISLKHRLNLIGAFSVDVCVVIRFNNKFSKISAKDFISDVLVKKCKMKLLVISRDFIFGRDRIGNSALIKDLAKDYDFKVCFQPQIKIGRKIISSTLIRSLIAKGDLAEASKLLGKRVEVMGTVVGGDNRGRKIGFPTANIDPHHEVIPPNGVYIIEAWLDNNKHSGLANIGFRPTFRKDKLETIEIHLFDFKKNIYGKDLRVVFVKKLRSEKRFKQKIHLIQQINRDIQRAKTLFSA
jgi:riboflavin kinase/FMN adenylyltransferase